MKYYYIGDSLNDEAVEKFTSFMSSNPEEELTIYISSTGGNLDAMNVFLDAINKNAHRIIRMKTYTSPFEIVEIVEHTEASRPSCTVTVPTPKRDASFYTVVKDALTNGIFSLREARENSAKKYPHLLNRR